MAASSEAARAARKRAAMTSTAGPAEITHSEFSRILQELFLNYYPYELTEGRLTTRIPASEIQNYFGEELRIPRDARWVTLTITPTTDGQLRYRATVGGRIYSTTRTLDRLSPEDAATLQTAFTDSTLVVDDGAVTEADLEGIADALGLDDQTWTLQDGALEGRLRDLAIPFQFGPEARGDTKAMVNVVFELGTDGEIYIESPGRREQLANLSGLTGHQVNQLRAMLANPELLQETEY